MSEREKSVEQQIKDADLVNKVRRDLGEEAAEAARLFTDMDDDEKDVTIFGVGLKAVFGANIVDILTATMLLKIMMKKDKELTKAFIASMNVIFGKKIKEEMEERDFFKGEDFTK